MSERLLRMASRFSADEDPIFAARSGKPLGHRNVTRRGFEAARANAGLPDSLTFHDLRHAAASRMIDAGLDAVPAADLTAPFGGHSRILAQVTVLVPRGL